MLSDLPRRLAVLFPVLLLASMPGARAAGIVSWNMDVAAAIPAGGDSVAGVVPAGHWNQSTAAGETIDLVGDDGAPTTIDVAGREGEVTDGTTTYSFNTVGPESVSGENAVFAGTTDTAGTHATAANYAVFRGLIGTSQTVTVQMRDDGEWGGIAAFQVVPRPDPPRDARIQITPQPGGSTALLSWPAGLGAVTLEKAGNLADWEPADPQPDSSMAIVPMDEARCFYRLRR